MGSGTPHCTHRIAVGVRHATLNSQDRSGGPACHTEVTESQQDKETEDDAEEKEEKEDEDEEEEKRLT